MTKRVLKGMKLPGLPSSALIGISAVERDTGLSKDTLRVWERRYDFPQPLRDNQGERAYPADQVEKLRAIRRLMDMGHRPGKIIHLGLDELHYLSQQKSGDASGSNNDLVYEDELQYFMTLVKTHQVEELRRQMSQTLLRLGLARFVTEVVSPLNNKVGESWARGHLEIFEEHLYTESIQVVMRNAINTIPQPGKQPRILLTTFPQEPHGLGLLMAEAMFSLEGARCISLGVQTPLWDIALAATSQCADIVALSFSACLNPTMVSEGLTELRQKLPASIEIWAGGGCPVLHRKSPTDIIVFKSLQQIPEEIQRWREQHTPGHEPQR
jgi:DNA-binding transcriptional MerR regulator/methylmalonyl-CoA mutase cobalamin-binding subunit